MTAASMTGVVIETERLRLRRLTMADLDALVALDSDPAVMRYITGGVPTPREELVGQLRRWTADSVDSHDRAEADGFGRLVAIDRQTGGFVGWFAMRSPSPDQIVGLEPGDLELGYRLRRAEWGKGYATEGSRALVGKAFEELPVARVVATTMAVNLASRRVMDRVGLTHVRTFHLDWDDPIEGHELGDVLYAITRVQWLAR